MNIQTAQTQTTQPQRIAEGVPTQWDDERDDAFFRITASLFGPEFTLGATVLLASYDDECFEGGE